MFETDADLDFNDDIFADAFTSTPFEDGSRKPVAAVRGASFKTPPPQKKVVQRKFPGPAGLLPDRSEAAFTSDKKQGSNHEQTIVCSQTSESVFAKDPWLNMCRDMKFLPTKYNIAWVKSKASCCDLINQKAPFLAAIVLNVEALKGKKTTLMLLLKDQTGEIGATILHDLYEQHSNELVFGSVIVLKQFGVLTASSDNHLLTITVNNLIRIYSHNGISHVQDVTSENLIDSIDEAKRKHKDAMRFSKRSLAVVETNARTFQQFKTPSCTKMKNLQANVAPMPTHNKCPLQNDLKGFKLPSPTKMSNLQLNVTPMQTGNKRPLQNDSSLDFREGNKKKVFKFEPKQSKAQQMSSTYDNSANVIENPHTNVTPMKTYNKCTWQNNINALHDFEVDRSKSFGFEPKQSNTQQTTSTDAIDANVIEDMLEGIDTDSIFGDF